MCVGKAFIIRKGERYPDYLMDSNDHEPLLAKFQLKDEKAPMLRNFIRLEAWPCGSLTSVNLQDWQIKIDETDKLPSWFEDKAEDYKFKCLDILCKAIVPKWRKDGIGGALNLHGTQVKSLGLLRSVGGHLELYGTQVKSLGLLRSVGGHLELYGTQVKSLGSLQSVGGDLDIRGTQIKSLGSLQSVGGDLDIRGTQIKSLPTRLGVAGDIYKDF